MSALKKPILLVGCGKMGGAMLEGWLARDMVSVGVFIVDPHFVPSDAMKGHVTHLETAEDLPDDLAPEVILLAVKPQMMDEILPAYQKFVAEDCMFLSVAAGKTITTFEEALGPNVRVIRAMPNTPAAIGQGMTVVCPNALITDEQLILSIELLSTIGQVATITEESQMDAVTALSGSGPAYIFLMIEAMRDAGIALGLPEELATKLALQTVAGAGALAQKSDLSPDILRKNVTSPGGTTAAALSVFMRDSYNLNQLVNEAMGAAKKRSEELS